MIKSKRNKLGHRPVKFSNSTFDVVRGSSKKLVLDNKNSSAIRQNEYSEQSEDHSGEDSFDYSDNQEFFVNVRKV